MINYLAGDGCVKVFANTSLWLDLLFFLGGVGEVISGTPTVVI